MIFDVTGDVTGLRRALAEGTNSIHEFGSEADDMFGGLTGNITSTAKQLLGFSGGLVGTAGALGLVVGGVYSLVSASSEYVKTYNEVAKTTGVSVEQLQKLEKQFASTGLSVESFGTINQDTLDKLGDAFRAGGGVSDDLKEYGLDIQQYNKYLNQMDGGIQAVIHTFYEMRKAGKSNAEITNVMETLASDSSHLVSTLRDYSTEQNALNAIQSQHVILTNETALKYQDFDKKVTQLSSTFQLWKAEALGPTLDDIQSLFDLMNKDWTKTDFMTMFRNFYYGGDNAIAKMLRQLDGVDASTIKGTQENLAALPKAVQEAPVTIPKDGWVDQGKVDAERKAAAQKTEQAAKQAEAKRLQATKNFETAMSSIGMSEGEIRIKTFQRQQDVMIKGIKDSASTLKLSEQDTTQFLEQAYDSRAKKFKDMIDDMIGYSDPNKDLRQLSQNVAAVGNNLTGDQAQRMLNDQSKRTGLVDGSNPFTNQSDLDQKKTDLQNEMQLELTLNAQLNSQLGTAHEDYMKRKQAITEKYNSKILAVETQNTQAQIGVMAGAAGDLGTLLSGAAGEGSKAAEAAFAIQKGLSIAQIVMNIQTALSSALATPFPASLAAYAQVLSLGASIVTTAKGAASGKAHSGIDEVPTMAGQNDSTWILQAGERVVQKSANKDLTNYLQNQSASTGTYNSSPVINAPLIIQGGGVDDDAKFQSMLKKHAASVSQAVRNSQQRTQ